MDITGALRQLSLFAPLIDPMMLVEATAAGLSLDDVQNNTSGNVPPYRFTYLIDKAKQYASQVQGFGGALLSAIEKRDAQQLEGLWVTQQQNILAMTTATKQADIDAAQNAVDTLNAQFDTAQFRHDHFQGLVEAGLTALETQELDARNVAAGFNTESAELSAVAGVLHLIIDVGSPFAIKFGGKELGDSVRSFSQLMRDFGTIAEISAGLNSILGSHESRSEGWQHEVDMANKEITQITTQLVGANIRLAIAQKALAIHNKTIAQNQQVADFYTSRFSNIALYTWLATTMQTTYRKAYTGAYAMAKLAEQSYRFERNDNTTILLSEPYWSQTRSGLLSGEMLLGDLQNMERSFIETNYRTPEITQSFSMMQIAPAALLNLREIASCIFTIPELCFDLFYPSQYCRKIKAVRITIPCVAGPLTNVGATLTLNASKLQLTPTSSAIRGTRAPLSQMGFSRIIRSSSPMQAISRRMPRPRGPQRRSTMRACSM
jgi:Tc toxin complex TcA C-terminal TcB-binding domain